MEHEARQKAGAREEVVDLIDIGVGEHVLPRHKDLVENDDGIVLVEAARQGNYRIAVGAEPGRPRYDQLYVVCSPTGPNPTVAEEAARRQVDPVEAMIDIALERALVPSGAKVDKDTKSTLEPALEGDGENVQPRALLTPRRR